MKKPHRPPLAPFGPEAMDKQNLLKAVYEAVDWPSLYRAHPDLTRREADEFFRELRLMLGGAPEVATEFTDQLIGQEACLYTDGASRGNPGPSGIGIVLKTPAGQTALAWGAPIGRATNNVAEYRAVIEGLKRALELEVARIRLFSDSELLVRQLQGTYKVKNAGLRPLHAQVVALLDGFQTWAVRHIPREQNAEADALAAQAARRQPPAAGGTST